MSLVTHKCGYSLHIGKKPIDNIDNDSFNLLSPLNQKLYDTTIKTMYLKDVPIKLMKHHDKYILQTIHKQKMIKVIDINSYNLNSELLYPIDYLLKLKPITIDDKPSYYNDVIFCLRQYIDFLDEYNIDLKITNIIALVGVKGLNNAFWNSHYLVFGDGDRTCHPLTTRAIIGHEMTHCLVQQICDLEYKSHSGALNESYADIFGVMFEFYVRDKYHKLGWIIGSEASLPIRSLQNPELYNQPRYMHDRFYHDSRDLSYDNGGVHINSGITNNIFYQLQLTIDIKDVFKLFIEVLYDLKSNSDFFDFKRILIEKLTTCYYIKEVFKNPLINSVINRHIF